MRFADARGSSTTVLISASPTPPRPAPRACTHPGEDVARDADSLAARGRDLRGLRLGKGRVQIGDDDARAFRGKPRAGPGANATGAAEDYDDVARLSSLTWNQNISKAGGLPGAHSQR